MSSVLGIDIGTTATAGISVRLPDATLGLESRPVDLSSPHPGWAEEDPEQWWRNVCDITRSLIGKSGIFPNEIAAIGVAGMLPAILLLDERDRLLRPSNSAERRTLRRGDPRAALGDRQQRIHAAGRQRHQPATARRENALDREARTPRGFCKDRNSVRLLRLHQLSSDRREADRTELGAGGGKSPICVPLSGVSSSLIAHTHLPDRVVPPRARSSEIIGAVTAGRRDPDGACGGNAGCRRRGRLRRLGSGLGAHAPRRLPAEVRRLNRHSRGFRRCAARPIRGCFSIII